MASNAGKKGGRVTAKGTQPPPKNPKRTGPPQPGGKGGRKEAPEPVDTSPNRQMRRAGYAPAEQPDMSQAQSRLRLILIAGAAITLLLVVLSAVLFGLSGTAIGVIGLAAGLASGIAITTGKTWIASHGRTTAIIIVAVGAAVTAIGVSGVVSMHWPFAALIGCFLGALMTELSNQQMTAPPGPPQSAIGLLRRNGAQPVPVPNSGNCVWATRDGRIHVIVGASVSEGVTGDDVLKERGVRQARQRGDLLLRRLAAMAVEPGLTVVVDSAVGTVRDGKDVICSASSLSKALNR